MPALTAIMPSTTFQTTVIPARVGRVGVDAVAPLPCHSRRAVTGGVLTIWQSFHRRHDRRIERLSSSVRRLIVGSLRPRSMSPM